MRILTKIIGRRKLTSRIDRMNRNATRAFSNSMYRQGLLLLRESKRIVPVDTGNLKATGFARRAGVGLKTAVDVGYEANYAIFVHEDIYALHGEAYNDFYEAEIAAGDKHRRGKNQQAKFLAKPLKDLRRNMTRNITRDIRHALLK